MKIAASILSADFTQLGEQVRRAENGGADYIHVDVMDGRFVPNITVGPLIVEAVARATALPLDVHLMIEEPERYVADFVHAGATVLTVHQEATRGLQSTLVKIRELGARAGVSLRPATPVTLIEDVVDDLDLLLIMTVEPGSGGQGLIPATVEKVRRARHLLDQAASQAELEVDGGIKPTTVAGPLRAGARVFVAGSAIFSGGSISANIKRLRAAIDAASAA